MYRLLAGVICVSLGLVAADAVRAADRDEYSELTRIMDSARVMETAVFAPRAWRQAEEEYGQATAARSAGKDQATIVKHVAKSRAYAENAIKATLFARLSLQEYLAPRDLARQARAPLHVPALYLKAEEQFTKATEKVEGGDMKGGLKEAEKSIPLFRAAELEALRVEILGTADRLIEKATFDEAEKYAPSTLNKARSARNKADLILANNRSNQEEAIQEAKRAEYEARHASNIAQSVRTLNRNDEAWEKLMLVYEDQMNRIGTAVGLTHLPFDRGPQAAADSLITYVAKFQDDRQSLTEENQTLAAAVTAKLQETLGRLGEAPATQDPVRLAEMVEDRLMLLLIERQDLKQQLEGGASRSAGISR